MKNLLIILPLSIILVTLSSCSVKKVDTDDNIIPAKSIYNNGLSQLNKKKYKAAADEFGTMFFQHPSDPLIPKSILMKSYALFLNKDYEGAKDEIDLFVKLYPKHQYIDYAEYLGVLTEYAEISNVNLDQEKTHQAKTELQKVISKYPNTKYSKDAKLKLDFTKDKLAANTMLIGRYYLNQNQLIAALRRFQDVLNIYSDSHYIPEALHRMVEINMMLGLKDEANKYYAVLNRTYPKSIWQQNSSLIVMK